MRLKLFAILAMAGLASVQAQDITISSNADWKTFIGSTSANAKANVKLAADITIDDYFRGTFSGTLDGQGHTITLPGNLTQDFAPIGTAGAGAVFKNLNIVGDVTTNKQLSGVAWKIAGATTIENVDVNLKVNSTSILTGGYIVNCEGMTTFKNCHSTVDLYVPGNIEANFSAFICKVNNNGSFRFENCSTDGQIFLDEGWRAGGFVASDYNDVGEATFINCISNCDILQKNTAERAGGFVGTPHWNNNETKRSYVFTNCLQTGKVKHLANGNMVNNTRLIVGCGWISPKFTTTNCYYTTGTEFPEGANTLQFARTDDSALESGALCYALNGNQSQINFYQTLDEDAAPVLDPTHKQVFASGRKHCDGSDYAGVTYNNVSGETVQDEHNYVDNVCNYCGDLAIAADGYFHVVSPTSWAGFAAKLSKGITNINVKLDTDLTITQMLANNYNATFDGQGHTITANLNAGGNEGGIFGIVSGGTYKNIVAEGTVRNASQAGFIGKLSAGTATIENVIVKMDIEGTANVAGLVGTCDGKTINFKNVIFAGKAKYVGAAGGNGTGGFLGWAGSCTFDLENCAMIGDVDISGQPQKSAQFIRANNGCTFNMKNCAYIPAPGLMYVNGHSAEANANATIVENATDGKLCYLLNGDQTKINFYQTLGEDNIPTINSTHKQVYASGRKHCDGSDYDDVTYNNTSGEIITDPHTDANGWCSVCGQFVKDHLTPEGGYYQIGNANDLKWFANYVTGVEANVNAKLTANIDYSNEAYKNEFIGYVGKPFKGEFDGQEHTIKIAISNRSGNNRTGLFSAIDGATIKNLVVEGTATSNDQNCVGGLGGRSDGASVVENVVVKTAVSYTGSNGDATCGGFFANMEGNATLKNCAFLGSISTGNSNCNGGLVGWAGGGSNNKYINCLVAPTAFDKSKGEQFARNNPTKTNCHFVAADDVRLATGELCYTLNADGDNWYQTIGTDEQPTPFSSSEKVKKADVTNMGYATYVPDTDVKFNAKNLEAYAITSIENGSLILASVDKVPAGEAVVLKADEGSYYINTTADAEKPATNLLKGAATDLTAEQMAAANSDCTKFYALGLNKAGEASSVGFYWIKEDGSAFDINKGKGYLALSGQTKIRGFRFGQGEETTGIESLKQQTISGAIYNLQGQRVSANAKGIVIVNGKKVIK